jgi:hypothetical protein
MRDFRAGLCRALATTHVQLPLEYPPLSDIHRIHWKWIVVAGLLAEAAVFAIFFLLLFVATLAGAPEVARPMSTLDYIDAMVSSYCDPRKHRIAGSASAVPRGSRSQGSRRNSWRVAQRQAARRRR